MASEMKEKIAELADLALANTDLFLVDLTVHGSHQPVVEVFVDGSERDINMDECAAVSEELGFLMEAHELFPDSYRLNVSSPGLDRPLTDRRQYRKNTGRKVEVKVSDDEQGSRKVAGELTDVSEHQIIIKQEQENEVLVEVPFDQIIETKVIPSLKHH